MMNVYCLFLASLGGSICHWNEERLDQAYWNILKLRRCYYCGALEVGNLLFNKIVIVFLTKKKHTDGTSVINRVSKKICEKKEKDDHRNSDIAWM